jgi:hypothetical protein
VNSSSTELCPLLTTNCSLEPLVIEPQGKPHGKHRLLLSCIVLGFFTDPLLSNRRLIVTRVGSRTNVFTESLPTNVTLCHADYNRNIFCINNNWEDLDVGGWTLLKWILERSDGMVWIGLIWLRIGTSRRLL